jgi:prophage regulatory protein
MAVRKEIEKCSGELALFANAFTLELKKILQEVLAETHVAKDNKPNPVQYCDSKPLAPQLEGDRLIRLKEVLEYIPVARSTFFAGVKSGRYPAPVHHLGPRIVAWSLSSIKRLAKGEV